MTSAELLPTLTRYSSGLVMLHRYCLVGGVWALLGVVTGVALVRLMEVIWVVEVVGGAFVGFLVTTKGLPGLLVWVGGPNGGGKGALSVVLDGVGRGCLLGTGLWSLGFGAVGVRVEGDLWVVDGAGGFSSPERVGEGVRGGGGPGGGCLGSRGGGGLGVRVGVGRGW